VGEVTGDIEGYSRPGRAHIFTTDGTLLASLQAPEPSNTAWFGVDVAISGDIVVVGEYWADPEGIHDAGRAHIFDTDGNHIAILQAPEPEVNNKFGFVVDTDGEIVLVGKYSYVTRGGVFLFDTDGNYISTIQDPELQNSSAFGVPVAVSGDIIVAAAITATVEGVEAAGKAYIFDYEGNPVATLQSSEPQAGVCFGWWLDVSGEIVLVNEWTAKVEGKDKAGRAHIFDTDGKHIAILQAPEPEENALFGNWLAVSGNIIAVGEPQRDGETINDGRAYIFDSDGSLTAVLQSPEPYPGAEFGRSVAVSEDIVVVGEPFANVEGKSKAGVVHIFQAGAAAFTSSGLTIDPITVNVGGTMTISVECSNEGSRSGSHTITLKINGDVEDEKTVTVDPDESMTISFDAPTSEKGTYSVEIDGLTGTYEVERGIPGFPIESLIAGLAVAIIVLWFRQRTS
jgi:hypothetical protein